MIGITVQHALEDGGYSVLHVQSGDEALAAFDEDPTRFSGLVTDIRLGSGADGRELGRHVREAIATLPVVYMSGDSAHEHSSKGVPDSIMLQKPFALAQLLTAVSTLVNAVPPQST